MVGLGNKCLVKYILCFCVYGCVMNARSYMSTQRLWLGVINA